jgi:peroxiredoxin Q/BCP
MLKIGDRVPAFTAQASDGRTVNFADLRGKPVVVFFFPKAFTYGCNREAAQFGLLASQFTELGAAVFGVSDDDVKTTCEFATEKGVILLQDAERKLISLFGVSMPLIDRVKRITFVIDAEGTVREVIDHIVQFTRHADDALSAVRRLARR